MAEPVRDPPTDPSPEKKRKCGNCGNPGHDRRNCPSLNDPHLDAAKTVKKAKLSDGSARARSPEPSDEELRVARASLQGKGPADDIPDSLVCPITQEIFQKKPFMANDGHTYEEEAIQHYIATRQQAGLAIISPLRGDDIRPDLLKVNVSVKKHLDEFVSGRARDLRRPVSESAAAGAPRAANKTWTSLNELGGMFAMLDGMRGILDETLKDWKSPKIVVIGSESSGKSSLLERLMMFPLLPRDKVSLATAPCRIELRP